MRIHKVAEAGDAMGLCSMLFKDGNRPLPILTPACMALSWCMASWRGYARVKDDPALKKLAEQDLRDSKAVTLVNVISHFCGPANGSAYVWDHGLFKFVASLYLCRCIRDDKDCWNQLSATISKKRLDAFSTFDSDLAERLDRLPSWYSLTNCLDKLYSDRKLVDEALSTDYVFMMPPRHEGPARSRLLEGIQDRSLHDEIVDNYACKLELEWNAREHMESAKHEHAWCKIAEQHPPYNLEEWSRYGLLTVGQGLELLQAIENSKLVEALVTQRPPNSLLISHFMAMLDCTEHARLLLAHSAHSVYYNFPDLKYSTLTASTSSVDQVLKSPMGYAAGVPSPIEKLLRRLAVDGIQDGARDDPDSPQEFSSAPPGLSFGKLHSVPMFSKDKTWFSKYHDLVQTMATCEPLDKLTYLVGGDRANAYHLKFMDVARDKGITSWSNLLCLGPGSTDKLDDATELTPLPATSSPA